MSTSIVEELVVTSLEMEKLLSYEECEGLNNQNNIDYSLNNEWSVELYQQVVEKYNSLPVKSILEIECMSDIKWWNEFSRELEVLHLSEDEDYLF
ncbi:hypothetical protein H6G33_09630 [Calothrix sp. FACHB-1219]|uniref:hypothetical protein n=1 Tax=unclassified Calothrix TaxID=2619626 RepID=UPI00168561A0|nr:MULTISPECIES: hypothetical protein [unclassified Calothrix]MBD2201607.1 hypothetical protein [Calothrix sp. FACHB-168]MBD2217293.1 hypothetical protein [Calothrix sp. FACHB-1219]